MTKSNLKIFSIGFEKRSPDQLLGKLNSNGISRLVDVRCFPDVETAGYAKRDNLKLLLEKGGIEYLHYPLLAPTPELLKDYFDNGVPWANYEAKYNAILAERKIEDQIQKDFFYQPSCVLCLEHSPEKCHRRLALEYLKNTWNKSIEIVHL